MYSSNDRYYAAKMVAERREMMTRHTTRSSCASTCNQPTMAVASASRFFGNMSASFVSLLISSLLISLLISLVIIILVSLVLIPLGL